MTTTSRFTAALLLALATLGRPAAADETTFCNTYITALPYTITTQGHYCFDRNLSTAITSGAAITIDADFVLLDLNHFKLGGGAAGPGTSAIGIYANDRSNLTIRNGNIRGFASGIVIEGTRYTPGPRNVTVEDNSLDGNLASGIHLYGTAFTIRNNRVSNTGGSTSTTLVTCSPVATVGIATMSRDCYAGGAGEVVGNTVVDTFPRAVEGATEAIPIVVIGVSAGNRVMGRIGARYAAIIGDVCRDNTAFNVEGAAYNCSALVGTNSDN